MKNNYNDVFEKIVNNHEKQITMGNVLKKANERKQDKMMRRSIKYAIAAFLLLCLNAFGWLVSWLACPACVVCILFATFSWGRWFENVKIHNGY